MIVNNSAMKQIGLFFDFVKERQAVYLKKSAGLPYPWTKDPILQKYKFCNVHRDLDAGTQWIVKNASLKSSADCLFTILQYRLLNNPDFFDCYIFRDLEGFLSAGADDLEEALKEYKIQNGHIFSSAYTTYKTFNAATKLDDTIKSYVHIVDYIARTIEEIMGRIRGAKTAEEVCKSLTIIPGVGEFLAYEVYCDMVLLKLIPYGENDYVNVGPGAEWGLRIIFGEQFRNYVEAVYFLKEIQGKFLPKKDRRLTLRSIEHSLCEFRKYYNIKKNGRGGKLFNHKKQHGL